MRYIDALSDAGRHAEALDQLHLARTLDIVNEPMVLNNLANAMQAQGKTSEAIANYREAIRIQPDYEMAYYNLAKALAERGDAAGAVELYRTAVELDPNHVDAHNNLANLLSGQGAVEEAISHYERALSLSPDNAATHNNLAWVLEGEGRLNEALLHFQEALRLRPELPSSLIGLSWILATHPEDRRRDPERALELAERALELLPAPDPRSLDIAAAAYAAVGDYDRAVELARAAADLASPNFPDSQAIHERLALYRRCQPYREEDEE
jgi:protein O-GlcNAc transferase